MYTTFYGLSEPPFELNPNPRYLLLTPRHREALANLQYGISARKGLTLLLGDAGTGKSTLIRAALESESCRSARVLLLTNPALTRSEFIEFLATGFGLTEGVRLSKTAVLRSIEQQLVAARARGETTALVIDEAQSLSHELLEEVRLLANIETSTDKLLPVVLAGQPELSERLNHPSLRQLKQRVALRCTLGVLDLVETTAYIAGRIRIAGGSSKTVFRTEAVSLIHHRSGGVPRLISVICDNAMVSGFAAGIRPIGPDIVHEVCEDFDLAGPVDGAGRRAESVGPGRAPQVAEPVAEFPGAAVPPLDPADGLFATINRRRGFSFF